jgi:hypothetical protein
MGSLRVLGDVGDGVGVVVDDGSAVPADDDELPGAGEYDAGTSGVGGEADAVTRFKVAGFL